MIPRKWLMATAILASATITACSDTTAPKTVASGLPAAATNSQQGNQDESDARSGALHVTKECSQYTRLAGGFCTITSSNLKAIKVGTRVVYKLASGPTVLDTDVMLVPPRPAKSIAFGHVVLDLVALHGVVTISGGTGKFKRFHAGAVVSHLTGRNWAWDGTYSFSDDD
jgi:hypothetical protein